MNLPQKVTGYRSAVMKLCLSKVEIYFQVPDSTPTPAPFVDETPAPTTSSRSTSVLSPTSLLPDSTTSLDEEDENDDPRTDDYYYYL